MVSLLNSSANMRRSIHIASAHLVAYWLFFLWIPYSSALSPYRAHRTVFALSVCVCCVHGWWELGSVPHLASSSSSARAVLITVWRSHGTNSTCRTCICRFHPRPSAPFHGSPYLHISRSMCASLPVGWYDCIYFIYIYIWVTKFRCRAIWLEINNRTKLICVDTLIACLSYLRLVGVRVSSEVCDGLIYIFTQNTHVHALMNVCRNYINRKIRWLYLMWLRDDWMTSEIASFMHLYEFYVVECSVRVWKWIYISLVATIMSDIS